jgi:hypothetical protein
MSAWRLPLACALAVTLGLAALPPAASAAAPAPMPPDVAKAEAGSVVTEVRRRGHGGGGWRHRGGRHRGIGIGAGIGLGILGGIIASEAYQRPYYYDDYDYGPYDDVYDVEPAGDPRERCAATFRSFEWNTGRYTTFAGERKLCPYLR